MIARLHALIQCLQGSPSIVTAPTLDIFFSLRAQGIYNSLLRYSVDILKQRKLDLRVYHIPGNLNTIADALSRRIFHLIPTNITCIETSTHSAWSREKLERMRAYALGHALAPSSKLSYSLL
ncbi:hypothetical protein M422DRAFT_258506 [Sphaerobolus stellatus SS14]|uniref:Uncharacterized protein n=1 Tax=Sphaerobolus stellatus (strain SS14) TaxID=990650 RepID=A0A0C9VBG4_SPHS4|nr:hypothetical protein M422DRAFT_258506 [Sphaerobolus stellatus SS14]